MSAEYHHKEILDVFGFETQTRSFGTIYITEINYEDKYQYNWQWVNGPFGDDNGDFEWRQQLLVLNSFKTNPKSYVWAIVNRAWKPGSAVPKPKPWFASDHKIVVTNEDKPPYPTYLAKPR